MDGPAEAAHVPINRKVLEDVLAAVKAFDKSASPGARDQYRSSHGWQANDGSWIVTLKTQVGGDFLRGPAYGDVATYRHKDGVTKPVGAEEQAALKSEYDSRAHRDALESAKDAVVDFGRTMIRNLRDPPPPPERGPSDLPPISPHG
jgi:hypothetical protein